MSDTPHIVVFGAGSIGCYVGGRLAAAGSPVTLIGRPRIGETVRRHGLTLSDYRGAHHQLSPAEVSFATGVAAAGTADLVLVTVKSAATEDAGHSLAAVLPPTATVVSFQNGLHNAEVLKSQLPDNTVLTGMVPFNVVHHGHGAFHQGSEGVPEVQDHAALERFLPAFEAAGLALKRHADIRPVLWAKLLLNLNNPINALSDRPLKEELAERAYRRCIALAQREALALMDAAGIRPARLTPLPPHWIPRLLAGPDVLFRLLANRMLEIDPLARSSMCDDLAAGRRTEIDWINGEVLALAEKLGRTAPVNARLIELIREAEAGRARRWAGDELLADLRRAQAAAG